MLRVCFVVRILGFSRNPLVLGQPLAQVVLDELDVFGGQGHGGGSGKTKETVRQYSKREHGCAPVHRKGGNSKFKIRRVGTPVPTILIRHDPADKNRPTREGWAVVIVGSQPGIKVGTNSTCPPYRALPIYGPRTAPVNPASLTVIASQPATG